MRTIRYGSMTTILLSIVSTVSATASSAQLPAGSPSDIVVQGRRLSDKQAVRHLTNAISLQTNGQLARFGEAACPSTIGLPPQYGQIVSDRIAADAKAAGVAVGAPGCRPNIFVMLVDSGQAIVKQIRRDDPTALAGLSQADIKHLADDPGPVHSWMATELRNEDGMSAFASATGRYAQLSVHTASIINPTTQQAITGAVVLLDTSAVLGKTLTQLADYAAMRTLAQTRSERIAAGDDTILTLFAPGGNVAPSQLTSFDRAYLKSLYSGSAVRTYFSKIGTMSSQISKQVDVSSPDATSTDPRR